MLIERGEQYQRAIQLYFRKFKKYPTSMEQLEGTNNVRFLRRRYADPLTGKDEWRLIHIGPTGAFIDSLTHKPGQGNDKDKKPENLNTFITEGGGIGAGLPTAGANNGQPPRRASEQAALTAALEYGLAAPIRIRQPIQIARPASEQPHIQRILRLPSAIPPGVTPVSAFSLPAQSATPGQVPDGSHATPGQGSGFRCPQPTRVLELARAKGSARKVGNQQTPAGFNPGQPGAPNQAANLMLNQLLTTPRNSFVTPSSNGLGSTPAVGGGIAGVASTVERTGIKIYNDRSKYNEWEFIYDFGKDRTGMGQLAGQMGSGDPRLANGGQTQQTGFGGQGGIGQGSTGQGGFGQSTGFGTQGGLAAPAVSEQSGRLWTTRRKSRLAALVRAPAASVQVTAVESAPAILRPRPPPTPAPAGPAASHAPSHRSAAARHIQPQRRNPINRRRPRRLRRLRPRLRSRILLLLRLRRLSHLLCSGRRAVNSTAV